LYPFATVAAKTGPGVITPDSEMMTVDAKNTQMSVNSTTEKITGRRLFNQCSSAPPAKPIK
jgi:hypothetical protein